MQFLRLEVRGLTDEDEAVSWFAYINMSRVLMITPLDAPEVGSSLQFSDDGDEGLHVKETPDAIGQMLRTH